MKKFILEVELELFVNELVSLFEINKLIVGSIQRFDLDVKMTIPTVCTYEQHLGTTFIERSMHLHNSSPRDLLEVLVSECHGYFSAISPVI